MQSKRKTAVVAWTLTLATGVGAALSNYFLLDRLWTFPLSVWDTFTMTVFYGVLSFAIKYAILRLFNAREE